MKSYRIDPANQHGIHIVDETNGCERVFIPKYEIDDLICDLINLTRFVEEKL